MAVTVYWAGVVMAQVGNAFACRTERLRGRALGWLSNPGLIGSVMIELLLVVVLVYYPPFAQTFDHVALPAVFWLGLRLICPNFIWTGMAKKNVFFSEVINESHHHGLRSSWRTTLPLVECRRSSSHSDRPKCGGIGSFGS